MTQIENPRDPKVCEGRLLPDPQFNTFNKLWDTNLDQQSQRTRYVCDTIEFMHPIHAGFVLLTLATATACTEPKITKGNGASNEDNETEEVTPEDGPLSTDTDSGEATIDDTGDVDERPCADGDPVLEIGTGEDAFESINDGDTIEVIHGTQDGHHILGSLRTQNTADIAAVRFQIISTSDGAPISDQTYRLMMLPDGTGEPCAWTSIGMYAYLGRIDPGEAPFLLHSVIFKMDFEDDYGRALSQSLELFPFVDAVEREPPTTETGTPTGEG